MARRFVSTCSVIADLPLVVPHLPERGGDVLATSAGPVAGGGFNIVAAAARLGADVVLASPVGTGVYGSVCRAALAAEGVTVLDGPHRAGDTGMCIALVEPDGERTFVTVTGVDGTAEPDLLERAEVADDVVFVSGYDLAYPAAGPVVAAWLTDLDPRATVVFDPGPLVGDIPATLLTIALGRCNVLTCNLREAAILVGAVEGDAVLGDTGDLTTGLAEALVTELRPGASVLVRAGASGCVVRGPRPAFVPSIPVEVVDTTGAGDAHTGALAAGLAAGDDLLTAVERAGAAAALAVTRFGPATGPTTAELAAFLATT